MIPVIAIAGSQLGHAVVYWLRFGATAADRQAAGAHAYFPALSGVLSLAVGGGLMSALLLVAAAWVISGTPSGHRRRPTVRAFDVLPGLFLAQMVVFVGQEVAETLLAHESVPSVLELLLYGTAGQLPAAALGAVVIRWLSARLESAWTVLVAGVAGTVPQPLTPAVRPRRRPAPARSLALASTFPGAFRKRGPPVLLPAAAS